MAVTILSPWPTLSDPATEEENTALATAISTLKDAIAPGASDSTVERLGRVAGARVEQYAPGAPDVIRTEALIRFAGYLADAESGAVRRQLSKLDSMEVDKEHVTNHAPAFRNCAAASLLSPWKVRRAGTIKKAS